VGLFKIPSLHWEAVLFLSTMCEDCQLARGKDFSAFIFFSSLRTLLSRDWSNPLGSGGKPVCLERVPCSSLDLFLSFSLIRSTLSFPARSSWSVTQASVGDLFLFCQTGSWESSPFFQYLPDQGFFFSLPHEEFFPAWPDLSPFPSGKHG